MISHKLKLLAIDHNAERISDQEFAHQAFLLISDELAKVEKFRATKQNEQNHKVVQNEIECKVALLLTNKKKY